MAKTIEEYQKSEFIEIGKETYEVQIYAIYDPETNNTEWYDLYLDTECINEGEPFYEYPALAEIEQRLKWFLE